MGINDQAGIAFKQPKTFDERFGIAEQCSARLDMKSPVLIDDMDNSTCENYAAFPDRLYIVDLNGKVVYKGGRGPFGYKPREMEQTLLLVMMESQIRARQDAEKKAEEKKAEEKKAQEKKAQEKKAQEKKAQEKPVKKIPGKDPDVPQKTKRRPGDKPDGTKLPGGKPRPEPPGPEPPGPEPQKLPSNQPRGSKLPM